MPILEMFFTQNSRMGQCFKLSPQRVRGKAPEALALTAFSLTKTTYFISSVDLNWFDILLNSRLWILVHGQMLCQKQLT